MGDDVSALASRIGLPVSAVRTYAAALADGVGQAGDQTRLLPAVLRCLAIQSTVDNAASLGLTDSLDEQTCRRVSRSAGRLAPWLRAHSGASYKQQFDYFVASMDYEKDPAHLSYQPPQPPQIDPPITIAAGKPPSDPADRRYTGRRSSVAVAPTMPQPQQLLSTPRETPGRGIDDGKWTVLSEGLGSKPKVPVADLSPSVSLTRLPPQQQRSHGPVITGGRFGGAVYGTSADRLDALDSSWAIERLGAGKAEAGDDSDGESEDRWAQMGSAPARDALPLDPREDAPHAPHAPPSPRSVPRRSVAGAAAAK